ncbi:MAG: type I restriction enzyme HsdR N-terminal domain-containing protein [Cytophagaceae bacterium]|nr:type I restriction enzyme HsdR N-terminal domain-containing protein [Cytophagaceae bacterium]
MQRLNLPSFEYTIRENNGKASIFDILRKKFVVLTPEEWVRQHFVNLLITHYKYPRSLIKLESGLKYNEMNKRSDIKVFDRDGNLFLLVECKAADVAVSQKTFEQVSLYNSSLKSKYIAITNGLNHFCCCINHEEGKYEFMKDLPVFNEF